MRKDLIVFNWFDERSSWTVNDSEKLFTFDDVKEIIKSIDNTIPYLKVNDGGYVYDVYDVTVIVKNNIYNPFYSITINGVVNGIGKDVNIRPIFKNNGVIVLVGDTEIVPLVDKLNSIIEENKNEINVRGFIGFNSYENNPTDFIAGLHLKKINKQKINKQYTHTTIPQTDNKGLDYIAKIINENIRLFEVNSHAYTILSNIKTIIEISKSVKSFNYRDSKRLDVFSNGLKYNLNDLDGVNNDNFMFFKIILKEVRNLIVDFRDNRTSAVGPEYVREYAFIDGLMGTYSTITSFVESLDKFIGTHKVKDYSRDVSTIVGEEMISRYTDMESHIHTGRIKTNDDLVDFLQECTSIAISEVDTEDIINWVNQSGLTLSKSDTLNFNRPEQHSEHRLLVLKVAIDIIDKKIIWNRQNVALGTLIRAIRHFISMAIDNTNYDLNYTSGIQNHFYKILTDIEILNPIKEYMFKANIHIEMSDVLKKVINIATQPVTVAESIFSNCTGNDREHVTIKGLDYLISNNQEQVMVDSSRTLKIGEEEVKISKVILPNNKVKLFKDKRKGEPIYNTIKQLIDYVEEHEQDAVEHTNLSFIVSKYLLNTLNKYFILDGVALDNYKDNLTVPEILQYVYEQQNYLNLEDNDAEFEYTFEHNRKEFVYNVETIITEMDTTTYSMFYINPTKNEYLTSFDRSVLHCILETLKKDN